MGRASRKKRPVITVGRSGEGGSRIWVPHVGPYGTSIHAERGSCACDRCGRPPTEARSALSPPTHPLDAWRGSGTFNPLRVFCVSTSQTVRTRHGRAHRVCAQECSRKPPGGGDRRVMSSHRRENAGIHWHAAFLVERVVRSPTSGGEVVLVWLRAVDAIGHQRRCPQPSRRARLVRLGHKLALERVPHRVLSRERRATYEVSEPLASELAASAAVGHRVIPRLAR